MAQVSAEKLEHTGPAEEERVASVPQRKQLESTPEPPFAKRRNRAPDREVGKSRCEREPHFCERKGIRAEAWRGKGGLYREGRQTPRR